MSIWGRIGKLLGVDTAPTEEGHGLKLATAALMVQVAAADGHIADEERAALGQSLTNQFGVTPEEAAFLMAEAENVGEEASCLHQFTRAINAELDQEGRQAIVAQLWRVALADAVIDNFEENALAKIAGLLGVTPRDRVLIKQRVMAED